MTAMAFDITTPRTPAIPHKQAMRLAAQEYQRCLDLMRTLAPSDWAQPTRCQPWDVRDMCAHLLGFVEMAASVREQRRQNRAAARRGGEFLHALTGLQVEERREMTPAQLVARFAARAPKAVRGRTLAPGFIRNRTLPIPNHVNGHDEPWTMGYLIDVILTRDSWMHRVDITDATGTELVLTAEHDGVIVDDIVAEWAQRHGEAYTLHLTGPAGGSWSSGTSGPVIELDAVRFCRVLSGRGIGEGLLATQVPF